VQAGFAVEVLALEAEVLLAEGGCSSWMVPPQTFWVMRQVDVGQGFGCAVKVVVEVVQAVRQWRAVGICQCAPMACAACGGLSGGRGRELSGLNLGLW